MSSYYRSHRDPNDLGDQLYIRFPHILLGVTIVFGLLTALGVSFAGLVFLSCLFIWALLIVGVIGGLGLLLFSSPYVYLGIATLLITIIAAPYLIPFLIAIVPIVAALVVINKKVTKNNEQQLKINIKKNKELGPVAPKRK